MGIPPPIRQITRGILRDTGQRRQAMGACLAASAALLFAGTTFLAPALLERPLLFVAWWGACGWLTLSALLLAIFDILTLRKAARLQRRELLRSIARDLPTPSDGSRTPNDPPPPP